EPCAVLIRAPHIPAVLFLFIPPASPQIHTLSLHDALPISPYRRNDRPSSTRAPSATGNRQDWRHRGRISPERRSPRGSSVRRSRSEEHTSELQSRENLVCRLLLEKKKNGRCLILLRSGEDT